MTYKCTSLTPVERLLKNGEWFRFRQVFYDDYVIPMKLIVERMVQLKEPDYENVVEILNPSVLVGCSKVKTER